MLFKNQRNLDSNDPRRPIPRAESGQELGIWSAGILQRVRRTLSSLVIWVLLIVTAAALTITHIVVFKPFKSATDQEQNGVRPIWRDCHLYSSKFIIAVQRAHHDRRDVLADFAAFRSVWNEVSPDEPMLMVVVRRTTSDPYAKKYTNAPHRRTVAVEGTSFSQLRPLLVQIQTLILEGDGTGRGKLEDSGYEAEPAELALDQRPARRESN
jgi:hypothetical protein